MVQNDKPKRTGRLPAPLRFASMAESMPCILKSLAKRVLKLKSESRVDQVTRSIVRIMKEFFILMMKNSLREREYSTPNCIMERCEHFHSIIQGTSTVGAPYNQTSHDNLKPERNLTSEDYAILLALFKRRADNYNDVLMNAS